MANLSKEDRRHNKELEDVKNKIESQSSFASGGSIDIDQSDVDAVMNHFIFKAAKILRIQDMGIIEYLGLIRLHIAEKLVSALRVKDGLGWVSQMHIEIYRKKKNHLLFLVMIFLLSNCRNDSVFNHADFNSIDNVFKESSKSDDVVFINIGIDQSGWKFNRIDKKSENRISSKFEDITIPCIGSRGNDTINIIFFPKKACAFRNRIQKFDLFLVIPVLEKERDGS